ncbi:MAG TPA: tRNA (5-methylaminomethyl-2-thiouridine)(34)-methyltransferase MnmD [Saprospiraceae bacterium]|nr:tRNA (5-methylaminomethyl-2-thiouridine)(34)-methyltransferase MnmD [Saprospiraceae bacterium]
MMKESISPILGKDDVYAIATTDGSFTLYNREFKATYHSLFGAVSESRHTYLQKCLYTQAELQKISILEFGFGTGLNAFLAYLFSQKHQKHVDYTGLENIAIDVAIIHELDYPGYLACPEKKDILTRMHSISSFHEEYYNFQLHHSRNEILQGTSFNCIFFDAFAPEVQPELWEQIMFDHLFSMTAPGGCLVTYCSKGDVRRSIERSGYQVSRIPGAPGKRQMLQAFRPS